MFTVAVPSHAPKQLTLVVETLKYSPFENTVADSSIEIKIICIFFIEMWFGNLFVLILCKSKEGEDRNYRNFFAKILNFEKLLFAIMLRQRSGKTKKIFRQNPKFGDERLPNVYAFEEKILLS